MHPNNGPRLAFVCADVGVPVFGNKGCSIHIQEILRQFQRRGFSIDLFAVRVGGKCPADLTNVSLHHFPLGKNSDVGSREMAAMEVAGQIQQALSLSGGFDLVYERYSLWSQAGSAFAAQHWVPCILEINSPLIDEQKRHRHLENEKAAREIEQKVFGDCDSLIAVSPAVAQYIQQVCPNSSPISVISNGVDVDRFIPAEKDQPSGLRIGFMGTLKPWHGLETLFQAFEQLHQRNPDARLVIIGEGPMRETLERSLGGPGNSLSQAIQWKGLLPSAEIPAALRELDIAVAPYPALDDFYFSPLKVFEYMSVGLPVVASGIGQLKDIIDHGVDGLLVTPGQPEALLEALLQLSESAEDRRRLGARARQKAVSRYSWYSVMDQTLASIGWDVSENCLLSGKAR